RRFVGLPDAPTGAGRVRTEAESASRGTQASHGQVPGPFARSHSRSRAMPDRWEQYGIDPAEITAPVDAALMGNAVARRGAEEASAALLRTMSERATPLTKGSTKAQQAALAADIAAIFRNVAAQYESRFNGLSGRSVFHASSRTRS